MSNTIWTFILVQKNSRPIKKEIIINQQEWIEYFELVNGRKPTPAELYQAQATGEFILERPNILSSNEQVREQRPTKPA